MIKKTSNTEIDLVPAKEVEQFKKEIAVAEKYSLNLEVKSDDDYQSALIEGKQIKEKLEIITARKEQITKPLNLALKSVRGLFAPLESAGESALRTIKTKMLSYTTQKEREAEIAKQ